MKESLLGGLNLEAARVALQLAPQGGKAALPTVPALYLSLDAIEPDPAQPRRFTPEDDDDLANLAASILQHGVIQPISVEARGAGRYQIVAGERRWRAAKIALAGGSPCARRGYDLSRIPAVIAQSENPTDRLEMQLVENLARADMRNEDVAVALRSLLDTLQVRPAEMARRLGRSASWLRAVLVMGSAEAREIAGQIGVALESIGMNEMQRLIVWRSDPDKTCLLDAVATRIGEGAAFSRSLLNDLEARFTEERERAVMGGSKESVVSLVQDRHANVAEHTETIGSPCDGMVPEQGIGHGPVTSDEDRGDEEESWKHDGIIDAQGRAVALWGRDDATGDGDAHAGSVPDAVFFLPVELVRQIFGLVNEAWSGIPTSERFCDAIRVLMGEVQEQRAKAVRSGTFTIRPDTPDGEL